MINVKKYFNIDYWGDNWYTIDTYRYSFYRDAFGLEPMDLTLKKSIKVIWNNLKKNPINYIKNVIYYLPACWYMFKTCIITKITKK